MAARKVQSKVRVRGKGPPEVPIGPDARGNVRIYADISHAHSVELAVLAARGSVSKKAMLEKLIFDAVERARIA